MVAFEERVPPVITLLRHADPAELAACWAATDGTHPVFKLGNVGAAPAWGPGGAKARRDLLKELSSHLGDGIGAIFANWSPYVLVVVGSAAMLLASHALAAGPPIAEVLRRPEVRWFFAGVFLTVLAHSALYAFFSLYLDSLGYGKQVVGMLWAVSVMVEIIWFAFQGRMLERGTLHHWLIAAALLTAVRFAMTASFGASLGLLMLAQCAHAITFAAQHTACIALVTRYFPGRLRGRGQALYSVLGYGCSGVLGSVGGAWLVTRHGYPAVFWAASVAALGGALCSWRSWRLDQGAEPLNR